MAVGDERELVSCHGPVDDQAQAAAGLIKTYRDRGAGYSPSVVDGAALLRCKPIRLQSHSLIRVQLIIELVSVAGVCAASVCSRRRVHIVVLFMIGLL